jgi:hypothetical protein
LKDKFNKIVTNNKNIGDLYRGTNEFKRGYQPRRNIVKYDNGDLLADSHNILKRWKSYFSRLLNVHRVNNIRQIKIRTAEPLVSDPRSFEVQIAIAKLKKFKSQGSYQFMPELIQAGYEKVRSKIYKLINSILNKEELPNQLLHEFTRR